MGLKTIPVVQGVGEKEEQKEGWGSLRSPVGKPLAS